MRVANRFQLGGDVSRAIVEAKSAWQTGNRDGYLKPHVGHELATVVRRGPGSQLWECYVGHAHVGDPKRAGRRRLVLWIDSGQIKRLFFSDGHYESDSWSEITG